MVINENNKKVVKAEHLANWFFGNYCAKCGMIDLEDFGASCRKKIDLLVKEIEIEKMSYRDFILLMRRSLFCKPFARKFEECACCKRIGISNKYWIKNWGGWKLGGLG